MKELFDHTPSLSDLLLYSCLVTVTMEIKEEDLATERTRVLG